MRKHIRSLAMVLSVFMVFTASVVTFAPIAKATQSELEAAELALEELKEESARLEAELESLVAEQAKAYTEKEALENQIANMIELITATELVIEELEKDIEVQTANLEAAEIKMENQYETFKTRIRVMYEGGNSTYLDIILASNSFMDMLSNYEIAKQIMDSDLSLFDEYTENARIVEQAKIALEENKLSQEEHKESLSYTKAQLDTDLAKVEVLMAQLEADEEAKLDALASASDAEDAMSEEIAELARQLAQSTTTYIGGEFLWPTAGSITSYFGMRTHPITGEPSTMHKGIDIGAPGGQAILAANTGTVIVSTYSSSYGNYVMIDHGGGMVTTYAHMSQRLCSVGDVMVKGETIGLVGSTGWSTGNHLHFEIIKDGEHQDPMGYFTTG